MKNHRQRHSEKYIEIQEVIKETESGKRHFSEVLKERGIPYLSFSQISTVESCEYRYWLEYVQLVKLEPEPAYFIKGSLIHQVIADSYRAVRNGKEINSSQYDAIINGRFDEHTKKQLKNTVQVHLDNLWQDSEVLGIEEPFVMMIDDDLPPCVGVIDLIIKKDNQIILIDHKTGGNFYPQDALQMAIYREKMRRDFIGARMRFYYDKYRWVNNLHLIRKPAMERVEALPSSLEWGPALERIKLAYETIKRIEKDNHALQNGECFRCPFREECWA